MGIFIDFYRRLTRTAPVTMPATRHPMGTQSGERQDGERGQRSSFESQLQAIRRQMWVDPELRATIADIRDMDRRDGRVKKIHRVTSRAAAKGGVRLNATGQPAWLQREWERYARRLQLYRHEKLESDVRGLMMEGNLPLQWVLDRDQANVVAGIRMPSDTLVPQTTMAGTFANPKAAYRQVDLRTGETIATFPLWQLSVARLGPDNHDDWGSLGRPYLDASREIWKQLRMTEEDLVIRRRMRAPLRMSHFLEGASAEELQLYRVAVESDQAHGAHRDYYSNKKGSVSAVQGDSNLDQISDIAHMLDGFFSGAPAPKGLFGYAGELQRDILEDLKKDFFDELDALQDTVAWNYEQGFRLQILLTGRNPDACEFWIEFAERRTDTANQRADLGLKLQALGVPRPMVWEASGVDLPAAERALDKMKTDSDPYPEDGLDTPPLPGEVVPARARVTVTPGNGRKGESGTAISTTTSDG